MRNRISLIFIACLAMFCMAGTGHKTSNVSRPSTPVPPPPSWLDPDAALIVAAMTNSPPDAAQQTNINTTVLALKGTNAWNENVWTNLGALYMMAAQDEQAARVDWITRSEATVVPTPAFTNYEGYAGPSGYIDPNRNFYTEAKFGLSNACIFLCSYTNGTSESGSGVYQMGVFDGAYDVGICLGSIGQSGPSYLNVGPSDQNQYTMPSNRVFVIYNRPPDNAGYDTNGATQFYQYLNGEDVTASVTGGGAEVAAGIPNANMAICKIGSYGGFESARTISVVGWGLGMSTGQVAALNYAITNYMSLIGKELDQ